MEIACELGPARNRWAFQSHVSLHFSLLLLKRRIVCLHFSLLILNEVNEGLQNLLQTFERAFEGLQNPLRTFKQASEGLHFFFLLEMKAYIRLCEGW